MSVLRRIRNEENIEYDRRILIFYLRRRRNNSIIVEKRLIRNSTERNWKKITRVLTNMKSNYNLNLPNHESVTCELEGINRKIIFFLQNGD